MVRDANAADQAGNEADALAHLQTLQKYAPLTQFPSFDVQLLCKRIYKKLSKPDDASGCDERAAAMANILQKQSGSGATPDDPVRVITVAELTDWVDSQSGHLSGARGYPYHGEDLQAVTYTSTATAGQAVVVYFRLTPRFVASLNKTAHDIFAPLPVSPKDGQYQTALTHAHEERVKFLNDQSFNYPELIQLCNESNRDAMALAQRGDFNAALSKLREIERVRPLQQIPIFSVISNYSFLLGKTGNVEAQIDARLFLFGITQDIAHSGDGSTPESAIHIVATSEEFSWLAAKQMRFTRQRLVQKGDQRYDIIDATDQDGNAHSYYFNVSQLFIRETSMIH
ncbi:DUF4919 domain-containing protein [Paraburkholderia sp. D15]|uniref:DUF4919 domain-containing protein n=1 Tax=Paraburkholderia sp. D15 TaxID=2880218 RepID=UPI00247AA156|nr:DUF4919 domain-containing protein [Paraburkholderia sp. D15]WGS53101.1 DUF4919 domain-containing protein [Paraburkholderia sp. D15]